MIKDPFNELLKEVGLEDVDTTSKEIVNKFLPAALAGLCDGDIIAFHTPYTGKEAELYGEKYFNHGKVAKAIARAAIENGPKPGRIYDLQTTLAQLATRPGHPYEVGVEKNSIRIFQEVIEVNNNPLALQRTPKLIVDLTPCLTSRSYLSDQINFIRRKTLPFAYLPLTRMHFTNQAFLNTYDARYGSGMADDLAGKKLYVGREDGAAAGMKAIIDAQLAHHAPVEVADVVLCANTEHSSERDLHEAITKIPQILNDEGIAVLRSFANPIAQEIGAEQLTSWGMQVGLRVRDTTMETVAVSRGAQILSGHEGDRDLQIVVLTK